MKEINYHSAAKARIRRREMSAWKALKKFNEQRDGEYVNMTSVCQGNDEGFVLFFAHQLASGVAAL